MTKALVFMLLFSTAVFAWESDEHGDWLNHYSGDINDRYKVGMTLIFRGDQVTGDYHYTRYTTDIKIDGRLYDNRIRLNEYDEDGNVRAVFDGEFIKYSDQDPRRRYAGEPSELFREVIVGEWRRVGEDEGMPFYLGKSHTIHRPHGQARYYRAGAELGDDARIHESAKKFWRAVQDDDRATVARLIRYPIYATYAENKGKYFQNEAEFIEYYDRIFTPALKEVIARAVPHNMFANYNGIMLGRGEVWFQPDGRALSIINEYWRGLPVETK